MKSIFRKIHNIREKLVFALSLAACMLAYWHGLDGGFMFDDYPNIVHNQRLSAIDEITFDAIHSAISQEQPGPIGRPISFISFAINTALSGLNPYYFKLTNLAIHLLNGVLLLNLILILLKQLIPRSTQTEIYAIALTTTAAWLLHPINLTSVLYVVQRMTELSAFFILLSLLLYATARTRQIEGQSGAPLRLSLIPLTFLLALFSKETGALLIVYLFLIEWLVFRFAAKSSTTSRRVRYTYLVMSIVIAPVALFMLYHFSFGYGHREFNLSERLMSEGRILWFYIQSILIPNTSSMALFHDDFVISRGLFLPPQTLLALLGLSILITTAVWLRKKARVVAFGILFFFSTQLLESTVIPLELIHEHRNYIGSWALLLPASYYLITFGKRHGASLLVYCLTCLLIIALGINTYMRSWYWGHELLLAQQQALLHPNSYRNMLTAGSAFSSLLMESNAEEYLRLGLDYYIRAYQIEPQESKALVSIVSIMYQLNDKKGLERYSQLLLETLRNGKISTETANAFIVTSQCVAGNNCQFPFDLYKKMCRVLLANPFIKSNSEFYAKVISANSNIAYLEGDIDQAIEYGEQSILLEPSEPQYYLNQAMLMISIKAFNKTKEYLAQARAIDNTQFIENKIAPIENMLHAYEAHENQQGYAP
jgi:protein O-mannosyl-transferase